MGLNAIGVFGFLTRAHLDHMASIDLALSDRTADIEARLAIQGRTVADLDRRIAQIDTAIEESTRLGRPLGAISIADQKRRERAEITAQRQREAQALGSLQIEKAKIDAQRRRAEVKVGPVRYLAEVVGMPATDLERAVRLVTWRLSTCLIRWRWRCCSPPAVTRGDLSRHRQPRYRTKCWPDPRAAKRLHRDQSQDKDLAHPARSFLTPYAPVVLTLRGPRAAIPLGCNSSSLRNGDYTCR